VNGIQYFVAFRPESVLWLIHFNEPGTYEHNSFCDPREFFLNYMNRVFFIIRNFPWFVSVRLISLSAVVEILAFSRSLKSKLQNIK
jgi:hypothetical protein